MKLIDILQKLDHFTTWGRFAPALITRLVLGYGFHLTGAGKLAHLDNFTAFLTELGVPFAAQQAPFVAGLEYYGGLLLLVGAFTRLTSALLASTMVVALLTADRLDLVAAWTGTGDSVPTDVTSFAYLVLLCWLVFYGAGALSLDRAGRWLAARWRRPEPSAGGLVLT